MYSLNFDEAAATQFSTDCKPCSNAVWCTSLKVTPECCHAPCRIYVMKLQNDTSGRRKGIFYIERDKNQRFVSASTAELRNVTSGVHLWARQAKKFLKDYVIKMRKVVYSHYFVPILKHIKVLVAKLLEKLNANFKVILTQPLTKPAPLDTKPTIATLLCTARPYPITKTDYHVDDIICT